MECYIDLCDISDEELSCVYSENVSPGDFFFASGKKKKKIRNISKQVVHNFLNYLDEDYGLGKFLYAGSGWDHVPRDCLGIERVVHLSLEENKKIDTNMSEDVAKGGYFVRLGEGLKVEGDFRMCPFKGSVFDSCYIHKVYCKKIIDAFYSINHVVKKGGLVVVAKSCNPSFDSKKIFDHYSSFMEPLEIDHIFSDKFYVLRKI